MARRLTDEEIRETAERYGIELTPGDYELFAWAFGRLERPSEDNDGGSPDERI